MTKQNQPLFTELTPEQAAVIEGGLTLRLDSLEAIQTGSDTVTGDDPLIKVNGFSVFSLTNVNLSNNRENNIFAINQSFDVGDSISIEITDDDDGLNGGDDLIESFTFTGTGTFIQNFQNDFSSYNLTGAIF